MQGNGIVGGPGEHPKHMEHETTTDGHADDSRLISRLKEASGHLCVNRERRTSGRSEKREREVDVCRVR